MVPEIRTQPHGALYAVQPQNLPLSFARHSSTFHSPFSLASHSGKRIRTSFTIHTCIVCSGFRLFEQAWNWLYFKDDGILVFIALLRALGFWGGKHYVNFSSWSSVVYMFLHIKCSLIAVLTATLVDKVVTGSPVVSPQPPSVNLNGQHTAPVPAYLWVSALYPPKCAVKVFSGFMLCASHFQGDGPILIKWKSV